MTLQEHEVSQLHASLIEAMQPGAVPPWLANIFKILGPTLLAALGPQLTQFLGPVLGPVVLQILTSLLGGGILPPPTPTPPPPPGIGNP